MYQLMLLMKIPMRLLSKKNRKKLLPFPCTEKLDASWMLDEIWHSGNFEFHDKRFENGTVSTISVSPDDSSRFWSNMKLYYTYAPKGVLFFPAIHLYSKIFGIDKS